MYSMINLDSLIVQIYDTSRLFPFVFLKNTAHDTFASASIAVVHFVSYIKGSQIEAHAPLPIEFS